MSLLSKSIWSRKTGHVNLAYCENGNNSNIRIRNLVLNEICLKNVHYNFDKYKILSAPSKFTSNRFAFVFGNSKYPINPLPSSEASANLIKSFCENKKFTCFEKK